jgi:cell division protein FtsW (lipid II flippase)
VNLALFPLTGITLPFISYGGSSLISVLMGVGVLLNISMHSTEENAQFRRTARITRTKLFQRFVHD